MLHHVLLYGRYLVRQTPSPFCIFLRVCGECVTKEENKRMLKLLGPQHSTCQTFIKEEERKVLEHNTAAKRLNDKTKQYLMPHKRNRYTNSMPLSFLILLFG